MGLGYKAELCLLETTIRDGGSDRKNPMSANWRPAHLTLLVHPSIDQAVGGTFRR